MLLQRALSARVCARGRVTAADAGSGSESGPPSTGDLARDAFIHAIATTTKITGNVLRATLTVGSLSPIVTEMEAFGP